MNAPLTVGNRVFGSINITSTQALIAMHIDCRRLLEQTQATVERHENYACRLEVLNSIGQRLSTALSQGDVFSAVADCVENIIKAERIRYAVFTGFNCG